MIELVCIVCPKGCRLRVDEKSGHKVTGNFCPRGKAYGKKELTAPTRTATSIVKIGGASIACVPTKTNHEILKKDIFVTVRLLDGITLQALVYVDDIVVLNLSGLGMDLVATCSLTEVSDTG